MIEQDSLSVDDDADKDWVTIRKHYRWAPYLNDMVERCHALHEEHAAAVDRARALGKFGSDATLRAVSAAAAETRAVFAALQGWHVAKQFLTADLKHGSRGSYRPERRHAEMRAESDHYTSLLDHAEYFCRGRRPIAIVGHPYNGAEGALRSAAALGLMAEVLPGCWYNPGGTIGVLLLAPAPTMAWLGDSPLWSPICPNT